jgi:hypothetical protein
MGRKEGSKNVSNYHYILRKYTDDTKNKLIEKKYFKTQDEICDKYNLNRSSLYFIMNPDEKRLSKKWKNFYIQKLNPSIPIFKEFIINFD